MGKKKTNGADAFVSVVVDKSGSMAPITNDTIIGINTFIEQTKVANPKARFSLIFFDNDVEKIVTDQLAETVEPINGLYRIGGSTALLDAVGHAIKEIDDLEKKPDKVVVAVLTDGQENQSREYTRAAVQTLIKQREAAGWQFLFLGANLDSFHEAGAIGMARMDSAVNWQASSVGTRAAFRTASDASNLYMSSMTATASATPDLYAQNFTQVEQEDAANTAKSDVNDTRTVNLKGTAKPVRTKK